MSYNRIKRTFSCGNCHTHFSVKGIQNFRSLKCPLLLNCGHSICEGCIRNVFKDCSEAITCGHCKHETPVVSDDLREMFPVNSYILGVLVEKQASVISEDPAISFHRQKKHTKNITTTKKEKCLECLRNAEWSCHQCEALYCERCFDKVHRVAKALQKHKKFAVKCSDSKIVFTYPSCKEHEDQKLDFICVDCDKILCSHCIILAHQGHSVCTVKQKNEETIGSLKEACAKAELVLKRLEKTRKKLSKVYSLPSAHQDSLEQEVSEHFLHLHGVLQLMEETLVKQVQDLKQGITHSIHSVTEEVNENICKLTKLVEEGRQACSSENLAKVDLRDIIKRLEKTEYMPCQLISDVGDSLTEEEPKDPRFIVNSMFMDLLENHCKIEFSTEAGYSLVSLRNLPEEIVCDEFADSDSAEESSICSQESSLTGISQETSGGESQTGVAAFAASLQHKEKKDVTASHDKVVTHVRNDVGCGSQEMVTVCHIINPHHFFVNKEKDKIVFSNMNHSLVKHIMAGAEAPSEIIDGGLYAVRYNEDRRWYRARVRNLKPALGRGKEPLADIQYIDFGNFETVPVSRLRTIPESIATVPPLAVQCSLFGISPINGAWTSEANRMFSEMVEGFRVMMVIMSYKSGIYNVDLCQVTGIVDSAVPMSVRDALVFLEHACFSDTEIPAPRAASKIATTYLLQEFKPEKVFDVHVSHWNSPSSFYVQQVGAHARSLSILNDEMNRHYTKTKEFKIFKPEIGMPCVVLSSPDKKWLRAQVTDLPGDRKVKVFFVDIGLEEVVPWDNLRKLADQFLRVPKQAIHCAMSDVIPALKSGWSVETKKFIMMKIYKKLLRLYVDKVEEMHLFVTLYEVHHEVDICLNALLVREGYAISTGMSSVLVEYPKTAVMPQVCVPHKVTEKRVVTKTKHKGNQKFKNMAVQELEDSVEVQVDPFRLKVKVLALESPSCFHVKLVALEDAITELMKELQEYYSSSINGDEEWEEGSKCCVFNSEDKLWCRGIVTDLTNGEAKVFLSDFGVYITVTLDFLRPLDPKFIKMHYAAIACHLVGIRAAGDRLQWPRLACEHLADLINSYSELYITKHGGVENNSLPVELWVKDVHEGGPLEPATEEWITLNQKLIDQGLAIPVKGSNSNQISPSCEVLKELMCISNEKNIATLPKVDVLRCYNKLKNKSDEMIITIESYQEHDATSSEYLQSKDPQDDFYGMNVLLEKEQSEDTGHFSEDQNKLADSGLEDWLPANPLTKSNFVAIPTYVDNDAVIYLHDRDDDNTLLKIQSDLQMQFENSKPSSHDLYWFPGQLCIAKYHSDNKWYRGKVLKVNQDNSLNVLFVDYGNVEDCRATDLRKNIILTELPLQCHKCKLDGITAKSANDSWDVLGLDLLHTSIVEKTCSVTVRKFSKSAGLYVVSILGVNNINIADYMVKQGFAQYTLATESSDCDDDSEDIIVEGPAEIVDAEMCSNMIFDYGNHPKENRTLTNEECETCSVASTGAGLEEPQDFVALIDKNIAANDDEYSSEKDFVTDKKIDWYEETEIQRKKDEMQITILKKQKFSYKTLEIPDCDRMTIQMTAIISATDLLVTPLKWGEYEEIKEKEDFEMIVRDLQAQGPHQPILEKPSKGMPCCAKYTDNKWYRAIIIDAGETEVQIQYVDYGNVELVPRDRIFMIREEWLQVPIQVLRCQLWNAYANPNVNESELLTSLSECIFQHPLCAVIKKRVPVLEVELRNIGEEQPVYQHLLDSGKLISAKTDA